MKRLIDYGITFVIFLTTLLIAFALSGVSAGQDLWPSKETKPPQAPPAYDDEPKKVEPAKKTETDAERRQRIENERDEAQRAMDFTPLKGAIDEGYDKPDPPKPATRFASREALRTAAWKDKTIPFTPKLPKIETDFQKALARGNQEKKPIAWWLGKESLDSREGSLIIDKFGDKFVHVYLEGEGNSRDQTMGPRIGITIADGTPRFVRMTDCNSGTADELEAIAVSEDKLPKPGAIPPTFGKLQIAKAAPPVARAPIQFVQAPKAAGACGTAATTKAARAPAPAVARAPVRRGG